MRVAGYEVDHTVADPAQRVALRARPESAGEGVGGDLNKAAVAHPLFEAVRLPAENAVALGVSNDGAESGELQVVKGLIHVRGNGKLVEFHEEAVAVDDAKAGSVFAEGHEVFRAEMEVAAGGEGQPVADAFLQVIPALSYGGEIEKICVAGMRSGDDVGDAVGDGGFGHGQRCFHRFRPVVDAGKNVAVKIDHRENE